MDQGEIMIRLRPGDTLLKEVEERKEYWRSQVVARDLGRYYYLLKVARAEASKWLTPKEQALIADNLNGSLFEPFSMQLLPDHIRDGNELDHLDQKWEIDGPALVEKLSNASPLALVAIVDAAERFWRAVASGDNYTDPTKLLDH